MWTNDSTSDSSVLLCMRAIVWSHMQATHDTHRRHERVGWRKKPGLYFPPLHACSLATQNGSLLAGCFYKVSYKTTIGRLKVSIRTQITTYLSIIFYGLTWERILPTLGALRAHLSPICFKIPNPSPQRQRHIPVPENQIRQIPDLEKLNLLGTLDTAECVTRKK